jgi:hypothetical protein
VSTVVERLLSISGEDSISVDRKFLGSINLKLPTRFVFLTNELLRLSDVSTALAGRFLVLKLTRSFYGQEDPTLTEALFAELPEILAERETERIVSDSQLGAIIGRSMALAGGSSRGGAAPVVIVKIGERTLKDIVVETTKDGFADGSIAMAQRNLTTRPF